MATEGAAPPGFGDRREASLAGDSLAAAAAAARRASSRASPLLALAALYPVLYENWLCRPERAGHPGVPERQHRGDHDRLHHDGRRPQHRRRLRGLLDLGYVAFYAVGAYTAGWLASGHFQQVKFHIGSVGRLGRTCGGSTSTCGSSS